MSIHDSYEMPGPTRDSAAEAALQPVYRQERFNIRPQRMPVSLKLHERPKTTTKPVVTISPSRVPILIRSSNNRPAEMGAGTEGSQWGVSDPGTYDARTLRGMGADPSSAHDPLAQSPHAVDDNLRAKMLILAGMGLFVAYQIYKGKM